MGRNESIVVYDDMNHDDDKNIFVLTFKCWFTVTLSDSCRRERIVMASYLFTTRF